MVGRGVAAGDLDNDGRVDLVVVHRDAPAALLRNRTRGGHWLGLRLRGTRSGRTPVGARVTCRAGGRTSVRWLTSGTSYLSSNDPRLWFGLGSARSVDRLEVRWPSGTVQSWSDVAADRILDLREGDQPECLPVRPRSGEGHRHGYYHGGGNPPAGYNEIVNTGQANDKSSSESFAQALDADPFTVEYPGCSRGATPPLNLKKFHNLSHFLIDLLTKRTVSSLHQEGMRVGYFPIPQHLSISRFICRRRTSEGSESNSTALRRPATSVGSRLFLAP